MVANQRKGVLFFFQEPPYSRVKSINPYTGWIILILIAVTDLVQKPV